MFRIHSKWTCFGFLIALIPYGNFINAGEPPAKSLFAIEVGVPETMLQGVPANLRTAMSDPLLKLTKESTGIRVNVRYCPDALDLAEQIDEGKIHFGVFQGHEFAWARERYPDVIPLVVAEPMYPAQSFCLVPWDCKAKNIGDLPKGTIALPPIHRDYSALYLAREKTRHMKEGFMSRSVGSTATDAIFEVIEGKSVCTIVDGTTLTYFQKVYPGAYKNLRILGQSEVFPYPCIAVNRNEFDAKAIEKLRKTLLNVKSLPASVSFLETWKLKNFIPVPDDYERSLKNIRAKYPTPPIVQASVIK